MRNEFTPVVERDEAWYIAYSPDVPGANGRGLTREEASKSLSEAIGLILEDWRDGRGGLPSDAERDALVVE